MNLGFKLWARRLSVFWSTRVQLQRKVGGLARESAEHERLLSHASLTVKSSTELQARLEEDFKEATQKIDMLQGKIDVLESQIELSSTVISTYQAVEETRIAIATADRVRALAEPRDEVMP